MKFGLIAGNGRFPFLVLEGARREGVEMIVAAIKEETDPAIENIARTVEWISVGHLGKLIKFFKREGVTRATLIGAVADELESEGVTLIDSTTFLQPLLAREGVLTSRAPNRREMADIEYGLSVATELARLDLGQTIVVKSEAVVALEAMEGTDATIRRASELVRGRPLTVVKVAKPDQDMRFDVPVIGLNTVETLRACNVTAMSITADKTLIFDRDQTIAAADQNRIVILGK